MTQRQEHPSFLTLDRLALGMVVSESERAHIQACAHCQAHIEQLRSNELLPSWTRELELHSGAHRVRLLRTRSTRWLGHAALGLAAAAAVLLMVIRRQETLDTVPDRSPDQVAYTTLRGAPSVGLYVKRGPRVQLWDGRMPIAPGDRLRLKVVPEGFTHVAVFSRSDAPEAESRAQLLLSQPITPDGETLLPRAWQVDDSPGAEVLVVVLGRQPLSTHDLVHAERAVEQPETAPALWTRTLRLTKQHVQSSEELDAMGDR